MLGRIMRLTHVLDTKMVKNVLKRNAMSFNIKCLDNLSQQGIFLPIEV